MKEYALTPVPKPRQTRADKWKKRPAVLRYRAFKDECRLRKVSLPEQGARVTFVMAMPKSWSQVKRAMMDGKPHQARPDCDNLLKALMDALYDDDCAVWDCRVTKVWGQEGKIIIEEPPG